jgi:hypothetical protein
VPQFFCSGLPSPQGQNVLALAAKGLPAETSEFDSTAKETRIRRQRLDSIAVVLSRVLLKKKYSISRLRNVYLLIGELDFG